uniref:GB1/RHD3-type G domain-containing protein n=1 Tax=Sciurus vulgaris TaxID=55149 RepID=A0A8D2ALZ1_SCIVU
MASVPIMLVPLCLVENKNEQLRVNEKALKILHKISQPVVVVAIVGPYHTGKSYLMNCLAGENLGFPLGSTVQSETKGIWMWCVPHPTKPDHTLVLLDTEGLGNVEKGDPKNDTWTFTLAVLLSSTLVYNSMGTINNDLPLVEGTWELVKFSPRLDGVEDSTAFVSFFPDFVWTVRDFTLELNLHGHPITEDEYLENALRMIPVLGSLVEIYVGAINSGMVPCLEDAVTTLTQCKNSAAVQKAADHYSEQMAQRVEFPTDTLQELLNVHTACEREAITVFMEHSFKDDKHEFQKNLVEALLMQNEEASVKYCQAQLKKLSEPLMRRISRGAFSVPGGRSLYLEEKKKVELGYKQLPRKGVKAKEVLQNFLQSQSAIEKSILHSDKALTDGEKAIAVERAKREAAEKEQELLRQQQKEEQEGKEAQEGSSKEHIAQLEKKLDRKMQNHLRRFEWNLDHKLKVSLDRAWQCLTDNALVPQEGKNQHVKHGHDSNGKLKRYVSL